MSILTPNAQRGQAKQIDQNRKMNTARMYLLTDLYNLYSEMILRTLQDLPGFIIRRNLNNIHYTNDTDSRFRKTTGKSIGQILGRKCYCHRLKTINII